MSAGDNDFPEEHWSRIKAEVRSSPETETVVSDDTETTECVCIAPLRRVILTLHHIMKQGRLPWTFRVVVS
jgi:hypothetical protein